VRRYFGLLFLTLMGQCFGSLSANASGYHNGPPAHARNGCYEQVQTPPDYRNVRERALVHLVRSHVVIHPAEYRHVREQVIVHEARFRHVRVAAEYSYVERRVLHSPGRLVWRRAHGVSPRC
jgi:hypothetical protein